MFNGCHQATFKMSPFFSKKLFPNSFRSSPYLSIKYIRHSTRSFNCSRHGSYLMDVYIKIQAIDMQQFFLTHSCHKKITSLDSSMYHHKRFLGVVKGDWGILETNIFWRINTTQWFYTIIQNMCGMTNEKLW